MNAFYCEVLNDLIRKGIISQEAKVLVVCGDIEDKESIYACGFKNVVISNLDSRINEQEFSPYERSYQDAENLKFNNDEFDFCVVHSGLHHCFSPHRALLEAYRVAKKGVLMFEPYDSLLSKIGRSFGIGQDYEHAAVFYNDCLYGGVKNSSIPNYVYRWTEKEVIKTINAFAPYGKHVFKFFYKTRFPWKQLRGRKNKLFLFLILISVPVFKVFNLIFPKQTNNFCALILKPELPKDLHPWLVLKDDKIDINREWLQKRYRSI